MLGLAVLLASQGGADLLAQGLRAAEFGGQAGRRGMFTGADDVGLALGLLSVEPREEFFQMRVEHFK